MKIKTAYRPLGNLIMVVQTEAPDQIGRIILPEAAKQQIQLNEGEVVAKGPLCSDTVDIGDIITWDMNTEYKMETDGEQVVLVNEGRLLLIKRQGAIGVVPQE